MSDIYQEEDQTKLEEENRLAKLASFAAVLADKRKEAIDGRLKSGIETIWQEDDDFYEGIDSATRSGDRMMKPSSKDGRPTGADGQGTRSTVFVNITQPYVDMAAARVADMLLPTDDKPFSLSPTPIPDMIDLQQSVDMMPDGQTTIGEVAQKYQAEARKKADAAETQIWDWLCESRWHTEMRKVIEQAARIGTSCIKGPTPVKRKKRAVEHMPDGIALIIKEEIVPESKFVDVWNIYPDPACGDDIHNGQYLFEKDMVSARQLFEMQGAGYIDSEIAQVIKEGPNKKNVDGRGKTVETDQFEIWYFHGYADADDLRSAGVEVEDGESLPVSVTMVNDRVIKASIAVFDSGSFPYDIQVWKRKVGTWTGTGIARQVRTPQRIVNGAARNMMDNAGVAAGPQVIVKGGDVYPQDGVWTLSPLKIWIADENADIQDVSRTFTAVTIPMMQAELENIIKMGLDLAERCTSMPLILQGQQGGNTQTVGGMNILQNNSTAVLRNIAKIFDDDVTEPHITRYYEWILLYGKDECKGDFTLVPLGSSAFYERDAQNQVIMQLIPLSTNKSYRLNPERIMSEVLKMNKISPDRVQYTDEEWKKLQDQPPPPDPRIQAAQINAQASIQRAQLTQQSDQQEIQQKGQNMQSEFALKLQLAQQQMEHDRQMKEREYEIEMMKLSQTQNISLDSIKAQLAGITMKLNTQKELSYADMNSQHAQQAAEHRHTQNMQAITPPTEPAGRAQAGHAFEQ